MSASSDFPTEYDAIVLGTGMTECIVAAALSRIGHNVLHLDRFDYYSGDWASFHFQALQEWIKTKQNPELNRLELKDIPELLVKDKERMVFLPLNSSTVRNVQCATFIRENNSDEPAAEANKCENAVPEKQPDDSSLSEKIVQESEEIDRKLCESEDKYEKTESTEASGSNEQCSVNETESNSEMINAVQDKVSIDSNSENCEESDKEEPDTSRKDWTFSEITKLWRKFNIDLMPKVLYCRGTMVDLLISSDVAKYCEFKTVSKVLTLIKGKLEQVPCSRSDVFSSKQVTMIEKRMMMKFLSFCMDYENHQHEYEDCKEQPFCEFLQSQKLSMNVRHYIQHSIAMVTDKASTIEGLKAANKFLTSLGRYGNTAFLWPVYGSGELPQCFCRMCAVFGGVYCLRRTAQSLVIGEDNKCVSIIDTEGQRLNAKWFIAEASYMCSTLLLESPNKYTSRAILLTDKSLNADSQENITLLSYPVEELSSPVVLFELPSSSNACPSDMYVVHLTCKCNKGAKEDFQSIMQELFRPCNQTEEKDNKEDERPNILWSLMYEVQDSTDCLKSSCAPSNLFIVGGPNNDLDFDYAISKAKEIFEEICPGQEFLPKAPNPEDIIWDDGEGNKPSESGFEASGDSGKTEESQDKGTDSSISNENNEVDKLTDDNLTTNRDTSPCGQNVVNDTNTGLGDENSVLTHGQDTKVDSNQKEDSNKLTDIDIVQV